MKAIICILVLLIVGCTPVDQMDTEKTMDIQDQKTDPTDDEVSCEPPSEYACHPVYEDNAPPAVCGCTPRCEGGTFLEVGVGEGNNPDGTRKGIFSCK